MSLISKIAKNTFYQIAGKVVGTILGLATIALITRYLGPEQFGFYTTAVAFLQFFGVLIDFGLQMVTAQMLSRPQADQAKIFGNILAIRLLSAVIFLGGAAVLIWFLPYPDEVKISASIVSLSFLAIAAQAVLVGLFQKSMAMAEVAIAEVWGRLLLFVGSALAVAFNLGLTAIVVAVVLGSITNAAMLWWQSRRYLHYQLRFDREIWREVWQISWPLAITISLTLVYFRADMIILSLSRSAAEVGIYGTAYKVLETLVQFPYLFLGLILPLLSEFYLVNRRLFEKILQKSFDFMAVIAAPMVLATWVLAEKIIALLSGNEFLAAADLMRVLIVAGAAIYCGSLFTYAIVAINEQKKMIPLYSLTAIIILIGYIVLIPRYGAMAAAILTVISEAMMMSFAGWMLFKTAKVKLSYRVLIKAIIAAAVMAICLAGLLSQNLLTLIVLGSLIYFTVLYLLKGYHKNDILEILRLKN